MNVSSLQVLIAIGLVAASSTASAGQFRYRHFYRAGTLPYQVVTSQLTDTGNLDLVVADYLGGQLVTLLGNGDGTFKKAIQTPVQSPIGLAVGDLNNDGHPDAVVLESRGTANGTLAVYLGDGAGRFRLKASYTVGSQAGFIALDDFDHDGKLDVAETDAGDGSEGVLRVFRGTGKGTLLAAALYRNPNIPGAVTTGDLNGDQYPDIAVLQAGTGTVGILLNNGQGKFGKVASYPTGGGEASNLTIADLRHDGKQDLVIADDSNGMVVLLNKGNGKFGKPTIYTPSFFNWQPPEACTVADFNLDGILDVACATNLYDSYYFYGRGDGTFGEAIAIADTIKNQGGFSIAAGDFNNDGAPDLAIPIQNDGKVAIMLNEQ